MKIIKLVFLLNLLFLNLNLIAAEPSFDQWKISFKKEALKQGISIETLNLVDKSKFLPNVIKYDRYQPEFYEDTKTYISNRTSIKKVINGKKLYLKNSELIDTVSEIYSVEKNLLLSLMGIETNFGSYLGKMDIISSLATLSYDKRRSKFFTSELITLLKLIDKNIVDPKTLYGSWAGAFGNFQFMPSTINNYAIDYNKNKKIDLKSLDDSFASAANYINKLGWNNNVPCFYKIDLIETIPLQFLNTSAKKIKNKKKVKFFKKYISNSDFLNKYDDLDAAIVTPDVDIVETSNIYKPAYIIFNNYELILKWNRSLRFSLAVCTLKEKFKNEL
tara:strand:+ start:256 stop:1251 length:996 start_codon:yes stop_codon:yes gene_type:complete